MATSSIDGSPVTRYQGRISGSFDLEDELQFFKKGDIVVAVVVLHTRGLTFDDNSKGDCVGTYKFALRDFALVSDDVLRKALFHHLPHLEPMAELPFPVRVGSPAIETTTAAPEDEPYHELPETVVSLADIPDEDLLLTDPEDGEIFSPVDQSRERARLTHGGGDQVLQRFLEGD